MEMQKNGDNEIKVSVCVVTYNHAPYIRECLDNILMQETNFLFEVLVNDDCSTDGTTEIIREYENKNPDIIKPIYHDENMYNRHIGYYPNILFPMARGKYIACCDGDDYWTDNKKLQKQFDIMEQNPQYSLCHHRYSILANGRVKDVNLDLPPVQNLIEAAETARIQTTAMFFRKPTESLRPNNFKHQYHIYQFFWAIRLAEFGDIYYINESMSIARSHEGGIYNGSNLCKKFQMSIGNIINMIDWYSYGNSKPKVVLVLKRRAKRRALSYLRSALRHFNIKDFLFMTNWYVKNYMCRQS